jgi:hypothetical protein
MAVVLARSDGMRRMQRVPARLAHPIHRASARPGMTALACARPTRLACPAIACVRMRLIHSGRWSRQCPQGYLSLNSAAVSRLHVQRPPSPRRARQIGCSRTPIPYRCGPRSAIAPRSLPDVESTGSPEEIDIL